MNMNIGRIIAVVGLLIIGLVATTSAHALTATINFDDVQSGSVIDTRYVDVTLKNGLTGGNVFAVSRQDKTGNSVSIRTDGSFPSYVAGEKGAVDAVFTTLQSRVSIDARGVTTPEYLGPSPPPKKPFLQALDVSGKLLAYVYYDPSRWGEWQTLTISRPTADIKTFRFTSQNNWLGLKNCNINPSSCPSVIYGEFDNLKFDRGPLASEYKGCYVDKPERALPVVLMDGGATKESCVAAAYAEGFQYAGLQFQGQCFAGNSLRYDKKENDSECDTPCSADNTQKCGGAWRNSIFATGVKQPPYAYQGCYNDDPRRGLPIALMDSGATVESCVQLAKDRGYTYAGLQSSGQCFAGNLIAYKRVSEDNCQRPCTARKGQNCGGTWYNSIYSTGANPPKLEYYGCYVDEPSRALPDMIIDYGATVERCVDLARAKGYKFAGLQAGGQCFAGNVGSVRKEADRMIFSGYCLAPESECGTPCVNNSSQKCGGSWRNSIYATGIKTATPQPRLTLINPHQNHPYYLAGSVHNHTIGGGCPGWNNLTIYNCGFKHEVANQYKALGFDFAAFTDHDKSNTGRMQLQPPFFVNWNDSECPSGMVCFWGTEATEGGPHHLFFGWTQASIESILEGVDEKKKIPSDFRLPNDPNWQVHAANIRNNISVLAHPDGDSSDNPADALKKADYLFPSPRAGRSLTFDGLDINEDYWDWALRTRIELDGRMNAKPIWGFCTGDDPQPAPQPEGVPTVDNIVKGEYWPFRWLLVNSMQRQPNRNDIYAQIKRGNFFSVERTGNPANIKTLQKPQISITTTANTAINVSTKAPSKISFKDVCGQVLQENTDTTLATYAPNGNEGFVRVVVEQKDRDNPLSIYSQPITVRRLP
jgi:hypothetical protein